VGTPSAGRRSSDGSGGKAAGGVAVGAAHLVTVPRRRNTQFTRQRVELAQSLYSQWNAQVGSCNELLACVCACFCPKPGCTAPCSNCMVCQLHAAHLFSCTVTLGNVCYCSQQDLGHPTPDPHAAAVLWGNAGRCLPGGCLLTCRWCGTLAWPPQRARWWMMAPASTSRQARGSASPAAWSCRPR
jgi:hypothetical protein